MLQDTSSTMEINITPTTRQEPSAHPDSFAIVNLDENQVFFPELNWHSKLQRAKECTRRDGLASFVTSEDEESDLLYYEIYDVYRNTNERLMRLNFNNLPEHALRTIHEGYGDCIEMTKSLLTTTKVVRFVDRRFGEKIRQQFLEGWKHAKFAYVIKMDSITYGIGGCSFPCGIYGSAFPHEEECFTSENEALEAAREYTKDAMHKIATYNSSKEDKVFKSLYKKSNDFVQHAMLLALKDVEDGGIADRFQGGKFIKIEQILK